MQIAVTYWVGVGSEHWLHGVVTDGDHCPDGHEDEVTGGGVTGGGVTGEGVTGGGVTGEGVTGAGDPPVEPGVLEGDGPSEGHSYPQSGQKTLPKYNPRTMDTITTTHATTMPRTTKGSILNYPKFFLKTRGVW